MEPEELWQKIVPTARRVKKVGSYNYEYVFVEDKDGTYWRFVNEEGKDGRWYTTKAEKNSDWAKQVLSES